MWRLWFATCVAMGADTKKALIVLMRMGAVKARRLASAPRRTLPKRVHADTTAAGCITGRFPEDFRTPIGQRRADLGRPVRILCVADYLDCHSTATYGGPRRWT